MRIKKAYTLIEILVVVIIIGVLATLGLMNYTRTSERTLVKEVMINLKLIQAAQKIYQIESGFYYPYSGTESDLGNINTNLRLSLSGNNWAYSVTGSGVGGSSMSATGDRTGTGEYSNCVYAIDEDDAEAGPRNAANCP